MSIVTQETRKILWNFISTNSSWVDPMSTFSDKMSCQFFRGVLGFLHVLLRLQWTAVLHLSTTYKAISVTVSLTIGTFWRDTGSKSISSSVLCALYRESKFVFLCHPLCYENPPGLPDLLIGRSLYPVSVGGMIPDWPLFTNGVRRRMVKIVFCPY